MTILPSVRSTLGAGFLGILGAAVLFGVTVVQTYIYYLAYPNDWRFQKIFVGILLLLDLLHLATSIHCMYFYMIIDFGNWEALANVVWSFKLQTLLNVLIVILVQSLYALRIWKLGRHFSRWWPLLIVLVVVGGYVVGLLLAIKTYNISTFLELEGISWTVETSFASSTAIDIILSSAMLYYLHKSRTSFIVTNNRIVTIMHYVVLSGTLTSACSLSALLTYVTMPNTFIFLGISFLLTKLYISSYMAMLNARKQIRDQDASSTGMPTLSNLRRLRGKPVGGTIIESISHKVDVDSFHLPAIGYNSKPSDAEEGYQSVDLDVHKDIADTSAIIGIKIHTVQERRYDENADTNS